MDLREEREAITIVVPQSIRPRWWSNLMRTQMGTLLRLSLPLETGVVITDVPYNLDGERKVDAALTPAARRRPWRRR